MYGQEQFVMVLCLGLLVGIICGSIPYAYGVARGKTRLAIWSFIVTTFAGVLFGLLGAVPSAAIFMCYITAKPRE
jgi:hypothetical protein